MGDAVTDSVVVVATEPEAVSAVLQVRKCHHIATTTRTLATIWWLARSAPDVQPPSHCVQAEPSKLIVKLIHRASLDAALAPHVLEEGSVEVHWPSSFRPVPIAS
jgi:hypothetical protein